MKRSHSLTVAIVAAGCSLGFTLQACSPSPTESTTVTDATVATAVDADALASTPATNPTDGTKVAHPVRDDQCMTQDLALSTSEPRGAAGSTLLNIIFTNKATTPCTIAGYPGVSTVANNNGTQVGQPARRENGVDSQIVTLAPGASAIAPLRITRTGVLDPQACRPAPADGIRVYPPDETKALYVAVDGLEACSGDQRFMDIQPVQVDSKPAH